MKNIFVIVLFCNFNLCAQISIQENTSFYLGTSSFMTENSSLENGYFYNIILNDSVKFSDTIFRNSSGKTNTLMFYNGYNTKTKWYLSMPGFFSEKPFKTGNRIFQILHFKDSVYSVGGIKISNPALKNTFCVVSIDTNGRNVQFTKIGSESDSSDFNKLTLNTISYNSAGNLIIGGYQNGATEIGGKPFYNDTTVSTYFIAEIDSTGLLIKHKILFETEAIYYVSRNIEFDGNLIFQTGFDSIFVNNKSYSALTILNQRVNDAALFSINKNNLSISNYVIMHDSSSNNLVPGNGIICNSIGILWPIESFNSYIKLNDTFIQITNDFEQVYFLLDKTTLKYKKHFTLRSEISQSIETDVFDQFNFIITFRNPGSFVKVNNDSISIPTGNGVNAFVVINSSNIPKLIFSVNSRSSAVKLSKFNENQLEIWVNFFSPNATLIAKSETLSRHSNHLNWRYQVTNYTFKNFSSVHSVRKNPRFNVYPNPSKGIFTIGLYEKDLDNINLLQINIFSVSGQLIAAFENQTEIDLSQFNNGLYYIESVYNSYTIGIQKLILQTD